MKITVCNGEVLFLNCTINSTSHIWNITALNQLEVVNNARRDAPNAQYNISVQNVGESILSTLSVIITSTFNGTVILCLNTLNMQVMQMTELTVLGMYVTIL